MASCSHLLCLLCWRGLAYIVARAHGRWRRIKCNALQIPVEQLRHRPIVWGGGSLRTQWRNAVWTPWCDSEKYRRRSAKWCHNAEKQCHREITFNAMCVEHYFNQNFASKTRMTDRSMASCLALLRPRKQQRCTRKHSIAALSNILLQH